jgi:hypothetical protein
MIMPPAVTHELPKLPNRPAWPWWLLLAVCYPAFCLMHLQVSLWLVRVRETSFGRLSYSDFVPAVSVGAALVLVLWIGRQLRDSPRRGLTVAYWLLWLAGVAFIDRYLTFSFNEYAHYPQYALVTWLLARAMDPQRTRWCLGRLLFWSALLSAGDELLQYVWITTSYSFYLDFNDFVVNLFASAAGLLLHYGNARPPPSEFHPRLPRLEATVAVALALGVAVGLQTGHVVRDPPVPIPPGGLLRQPDGAWHFYLQRGPGYYGSWQPGPRHGTHFVMSPGPALLTMLVVGSLFAAYGLPPRRRASRGVRPADETVT